MDNQVVSNFVNDKWIDRLYQTLHGKVYLIQKDSTEYKGAIKTTKFSGKNYSFTEDNRWFDNCGMPVAKPTSIDSHNEINKFKSELKQREEDKKFQALKSSITNNLKGDK
mgnify:CR=1 FL=1